MILIATAIDDRLLGQVLRRKLGRVLFQTKPCDLAAGNGNELG
jgi:hypothetical protein